MPISPGYVPTHYLFPAHLLGGRQTRQWLHLPAFRAPPPASPCASDLSGSLVAGMKKMRPSEEVPSESRPRTVPQDRCRLAGSGPASVEPLVRAVLHPRNAALVQPPFFFRRHRAAGCISNRLPLANRLPRPPAGQPISPRSLYLILGIPKKASENFFSFSHPPRGKRGGKKGTGKKGTCYFFRGNSGDRHFRPDFGPWTLLKSARRCAAGPWSRTPW